MIAALMLIALAGAPPSIDMKTICKDARVSALPEDAHRSSGDSCVHDEQAALDKLKARWTQYSASARLACPGDDSIAPSYVERGLVSKCNRAAVQPGRTALPPRLPWPSAKPC